MKLFINSLFFISIAILSQSAIASVCEDCTLIDGKRKFDILRAIGDTARESDPNQFRCLRESGDLGNPNFVSLFVPRDVNCLANPNHLACFQSRFSSYQLYIQENSSLPMVIITNGDSTLRFTIDASLTELIKLEIEDNRYSSSRRVNQGTIINPDYRYVRDLEHSYKGTCTF